MSCQDVVAFSKHFQFAKEDKTYIIGCTFKILKCPIQDSCSPKKISCSWFQEAEFKETCSLLLPNVKEIIAVNKGFPAPQKNAINILTGKTVKLAYHVVNNPNDKKVLTSKENKDKSHEDSFKAHRFSRMKVLVSVTQSGNQKDVKRLTEVLSQQRNLTGAKTIEISHYFERQDTQKETDDQASGDQPVKMKEAKVILQKLVSDGRIKEKDRPPKKSRLRTKKRCLETVEPKSPEADDEIHKDNSYLQIQHVKDLSLKQLEDSFQRNTAYLWAIYKGEASCQRHTKYTSGSARQRRELDFQVNLTFYHEEQVDHAITLLKNLLAPDGDTKIDYILRVLLPEFLIKLYMDLKGVDQDLAELKMTPCGGTRNADSPVKYTS